MGNKEALGILKEQIKTISPSKEETIAIDKKAAELIEFLRKNIKKSKISAEIFVGGSSARGTLIKKSKYDIDVFVRFNAKKYKSEGISSLLERIVPKNSRKIHGSRDYFSLKSENQPIEIEIIPVLKITRPEQAENITDLSYFHVNYVKNKIKKNKKLADEIRLAKAFAYYQDCYGAESYINGFSGYAIELLVVYYKSFVNFIEAISKADIMKGKIIIDIEKKFKNKEDITRQLNESKLQSPIVLIDPTYKERNALAALSYETFLKFRAACRNFLKQPGSRFFEFGDKQKDLEKKYGKSLIKLELSTEKQAGDIAGTKLKKFSGFFIAEIEKYFDVKDSEFDYDEDANIGKIFLAAEPKKEIVFPGPPAGMKKALAAFRKQHKKIKIIRGKAFAYEKNKLDFKKFLNKFMNNKSKIIEDMGVNGLGLV